MEKFQSSPANQPKGVHMPDKTPRWNREETETGEKILDTIARVVDTKRVSDRHAQASIAARTLGVLHKNETYKDLPSKIKTYLEFRWRVGDSPDIESLKKDWEKEYEKDPAFRHAMTHPEDE